MFVRANKLLLQGAVAMLVDKEIFERFAFIRQVFEDLPVRRLNFDGTLTGSKKFSLFLGGFQERYCADKLDIKFFS